MRVSKPLTEEQKIRKKELHRIWCAANRHKRRASASKYRKSHQDFVYSQNREWAKNHKEWLVEYRKQYRAKHRDELIVQCKNYCKKRYYSDREYRDRILLQTKKWSSSNKSKRSEIYRRWRKNNLRHCAMISLRRRAEIGRGRINSFGLPEFERRLRTSSEVPCYYCKKVIASGDAHVDHVMPICLGGKHCTSNLCVSCPECNLSKNKTTLEHWPKHGQMFLNM